MIIGLERIDRLIGLPVIMRTGKGFIAFKIGVVSRIDIFEDHEKSFILIEEAKIETCVVKDPNQLELPLMKTKGDERYGKEEKENC